MKHAHGEINYNYVRQSILSLALVLDHCNYNVLLGMRLAFVTN